MEHLRHIKGALPIAVEAKKKGIKRIILPKESANEAAIVDEIDVYGFENLTEVISFLNEESNPEKTYTDKERIIFSNKQLSFRFF